MCRVLDFREARGKAHVYELFRVLAQQGYQLEEILAMTEKEEDRDKLLVQYGITLEEATATS